MKHSAIPQPSAVDSRHGRKSAAALQNRPERRNAGAGLKKLDIKQRFNRRDSIALCFTMLAMLIKGIMDFFDQASPWHNILDIASVVAVIASYALLASILFAKSAKYKDNTLSIIAFLFNSVVFTL